MAMKHQNEIANMKNKLAMQRDLSQTADTQRMRVSPPISVPPYYRNTVHPCYRPPPKSHYSAQKPAELFPQTKGVFPQPLVHTRRTNTLDHTITTAEFSIEILARKKSTTTKRIIKTN